MGLKRGAFIVIEGVDRTGKTTQAKKLVESLKNKQLSAEYMNFPDRKTDLGEVINSYLTSKNDLSNEAIHLLFSANRWEKVNYIKEKLLNGVTVIVDRYCYSGVAYSAAKGLDLSWCKSPDAGLPQPDKVFFFTLPLEHVQQRSGFGSERYEVPEFQKKVTATYMKLKEDNWDMLDASRSLEVIHKELLEKVLSVVDCVENKPIEKIWV